MGTSIGGPVWTDARYALRMLRKSPAFTAAAVLTVALGIGATTAIFSLLDAVLLRALPVRNPEELVLTAGASQYPAFLAFRRHTDLFAGLCASSGVTPLEVEAQPGARERADVSLVSGSYFSTLGIAAAAGRVFADDDDRTPGAHAIAVVSYGYWQRRFGRDAALVNRIVRVNGMPVTIVGVAQPGFFGEQVGAAPDLWMPLTMWGHVVPGRNLLQSPTTGWLRILGRVRPGVARSGPQPALTVTYRAVLTEVFGPAAADDVRRDITRATVALEPAARGISSLRRQFERPLLLLMGAVVLVMLIACANLATLLLTRASARRGEIQVRLALGATRARLLRQLLTESLVLAALGGGAGVAVAGFAREALLRLIPADGSRIALAAPTDLRPLSFAAVAASLAAVLFGLAPAWQSVRSGTATPLFDRFRRSGGPPRLGGLLVAAQVSVCLVLLTGAGLFLRTLENLWDADLGFAPEHLIVVDVRPRAAGDRGRPSVDVTRRVLDAIAAVPGVRSASLSEGGVLMGRDNSTDLARPLGFVAGREGFPRTRWDIVGPRYFSTLETPLIAGRDFTERDDAAAPPVATINEAMARLFFPGADPMGRRLLWGAAAVHAELEIVAVTRDVKQAGGRGEPLPRFYVPYLQMAAVRPDWRLTGTRFLARAAADPAPLVPLLQRVVSAADPGSIVESVDLGRDLVGRTLARERLVAALLGTFGALSLVLASVGLYGVIAYDVAQRTREIGIRMALGAQRREVLAVVLRRSGLCVAAGLAAGVPLALLVSRFGEALLFGVRSTDLPTLGGAVAILVATALLAGYLPARRALRIDPAGTLRTD